MRVFKPLPEGHPSIGSECLYCDTPIAAGDMLTLVPQETGPGTVEADPAHAECRLRALEREQIVLRAQLDTYRMVVGDE